MLGEQNCAIRRLARRTQVQHSMIGLNTGAKRSSNLDILSRLAMEIFFLSMLTVHQAFCEL
jgi:hypothetical protein